VQVIDAHAVRDSRAIVFIGKPFPCVVDCGYVSFPVDHGDVGRHRVEDSLVDAVFLLRLAQLPIGILRPHPLFREKRQIDDDESACSRQRDQP
jgi:uncharacterized ferredoxin-like protein